MKKLLLLCSCVCALGLASCATTRGVTSPAKSARTKQIRGNEGQLFGDYLEASYAAKIGDVQASAEEHAKVFALQPDNIELGQKAMVAAHIAGRADMARSLAKKVLVLHESDIFANALLGAYPLSAGKYKKAVTMLSGAEGATGMSAFNQLMLGWAQVGVGQNDQAMKTFGAIRGAKFFKLMGQLQQAKLEQQTGLYSAAQQDYEAVAKTDLAPVETILSQARGAMMAGKKDKALSILNDYASRNKALPYGPVQAMIRTIKKGQKTDWNLTPEQQASRALTEMAFRFYGPQRQFKMAEIYLRLARELDPQNDKAKLFLGAVLERTDRDEAAMKAYKEIAESSAFSISARLSESDILFSQKKYEQGIAVLKSIKNENTDRILNRSLGRAYLITEDYGKALPYYEALIASMSKTELEADPSPRYLRGICLERLGRWPEAVKDFEFVLANRPDDADALNYLGYTWVDKGVNLPKAFKMIEKAVALQPESGAIIDSLGWAHYKLGHLTKARDYLEDAVERSPTSATIVDHLGDVYWKLGRQKEARYQWQRALGLDPTPKEKSEMTAKLKSGLDAVKTGS